MEHLIALFPLLASQPVLQAIAGIVALVLCTVMVLRANKDRLSAAPFAPAADPVPPYAQGPRDLVETMREQRDCLRRLVEDMAPIRDHVRIMREEARKQTELLERIAIEQEIEGRVSAGRGRDHRDGDR